MMDLERIVNIDFPDDIDANTITGLFMKNLSRMPRPGDEIEESDLRFLALDVQNNRVGKVQVYLINESSLPMKNTLQDRNTQQMLDEATYIDDLNENEK